MSKKLIWIYSDIHSCNFVETNIFGHSFVFKFSRMSHSGPYRALFAPLEVLLGTRFCSKHNIMVQLTNMVTRWVSLTHFWTFWPPRAPNRPLFEQIDPLWKMIIPPHHRSFNISSVSLSHLPTKAIKGIKEGKEKGFKLRNEKKRETSITYC